MIPALLAGEPQAGESRKALLACNDYLRAGPGRSLQKLYQTYTGSGPTKPPTRHLATLKEWSRLYEWQLRAAQYDTEIERQKNDAVQAVMKEGLALAHERVTRLKRLALFLEEQVYSAAEAKAQPQESPESLTEAEVEAASKRARLYPNVWLYDVKQIGGGEGAERVDLVRFNAALIEQFRGVLDDLAKETGGRRQKRDNFNIDFSKLTDDQLERIAAGEDPLDVIISTASRGGD
jgi:hypothetical protein